MHNAKIVIFELFKSHTNTSVTESGLIHSKTAHIFQSYNFAPFPLGRTSKAEASKAEAKRRRQSAADRWRRRRT